MELEEDPEEKQDIYSWEKTYRKTWIEDEEDTRSEKKRRTEQRDARKIRRGMTRHLFLVIDCSKSLNQNDLKPSRRAVIFRLVETFIMDYFDQNPLSQIGVIVTRNSVAEKITELSGNPQRHISTIKAQTNFEGEMSLQNALEMAKGSLAFVPKYGTREVVVITGSMTICDPGDIFETARQLKSANIQTSVIGLQAEVHVFRAVAQTTGGSYVVATNEDHLRELLLAQSPPPPATPKMGTSLIQMGFPEQRMDSVPSLCVCHKTLKYGGYYCPQCMSKFCELPTDCQICSLALISSPHLARSYHHLFPVPIFEEKMIESTSCRGCLKSFGGASFTCPECSEIFCSECDDYIHESLHNCPGCEVSGKVQE